MVDITTRTLGDTSKDAPLTNEELDQNFINLNDDPRNITSITTANTGIVTGGEVSVNAGDNTKFDITAGSAIIVDHSVTPATLTPISWGAYTAETVTDLATKFTTELALDASGNIIQQSSFSSVELRGLVYLGGLDHSTKTHITRAYSLHVPAYGVGSSLKELAQAIGDINLNGNVFTPNGANLKIDKTAGRVFSFGSNTAEAVLNPHKVDQAAQTQAAFFHVYDDGTGTGVFEPPTSDLDPGFFDDGSGTLAAVSTNDWTIQRIGIFANSGQVTVQYGTQAYNKKSDALAGLATHVWPSLEGLSFVNLRGYLIVRAGATDLSSTDDAEFVQYSGAGGGGGFAGNVTGPVASTDGALAVFDGDEGDLLTSGPLPSQLRDRATHTGSQAISTVTSLQSSLDAKEQGLTAGSNIAIDRTDPANPVISATGGGPLGELTASMITGQQESIALASAVLAPVVAVTKEVPQTGTTSNGWFANAAGAKYDVENTAYATSLTPSATTGSITLTLGSGAFVAGDVGKTVAGNGGAAVLIATDGSAIVTSDFNDTSTIASGDWTLKGLVFTADAAQVSSTVDDPYAVSTAVASGSKDITAQDANMYGLAFNNDGTKAYVIGRATDATYQYSLSTPFDITTMSYDSVSVAAQTGSTEVIRFNSSGTKMYELGAGSLYQHSLSSAFDLSTASYDSVSFYVATQDTGTVDFRFNNSGTKLYVIGAQNDSVHQYSLSSAFNLSTASYDNVSFSVLSETFAPRCFAFNGSGTRMVVGGGYATLFQYSLSSAFDLSTASYDSVTFALPSGGWALAFDNIGAKMYTLIYNAPPNIRQYDLDTPVAAADTHLPAVTNNVGQIDSDFWTDINDMIVTETLYGQVINYAVSTDGRVTFQVVLAGSGTRNIVRDNAGTWEYNSNVAYASETWAAASVNSIYGALSEAMGVAQNTMSGTQLAAASGAEYFTLGVTLDLAMILFTDDAGITPSGQGVSIDYDANVLNQGAVLGTDYDFDAPESTTVRISALANNNLKVRVV